MGYVVAAIFGKRTVSNVFEHSLSCCTSLTYSHAGSSSSSHTGSFQIVRIFYFHSCLG